MSKQTFWVSWYHGSDDWDSKNNPPAEAVICYWCTGYAGKNCIPTVVAWVHAETEDQVMAIVDAEWPNRLEWRFMDRQPETGMELPENDRFKLQHQWSIDRAKAVAP